MAAPLFQKPSTPKTIDEHDVGNNDPLALIAENDNTARARQPMDVSYLRYKHLTQGKPGTVYKFASTRACIVAAGGAGGIVGPDPYRPWMIQSDQLYWGMSTSGATNEVVHRHDSMEIYQQLEGTARIYAKWWYEDEWYTHELEPLDVFIALPGICHFYEFTSAVGTVNVYKAPPRPGVGKPGVAGKVTCEHCPRFGDGCAGPAGLPRR